jgi:hypothetical protein
MELIIKFSGRDIGFVWENAGTVVPAVLGLPERKVRAIRESDGPKLKVIAEKVAAILKGHVWPQSTSVWVEQQNERVLACPA